MKSKCTSTLLIKTTCFKDKFSLQNVLISKMKKRCKGFWNHCSILCCSTVKPKIFFSFPIDLPNTLWQSQSYICPVSNKLYYTYFLKISYSDGILFFHHSIRMSCNNNNSSRSSNNNKRTTTTVRTNTLFDFLAEILYMYCGPNLSVRTRLEKCAQVLPVLWFCTISNIHDLQKKVQNSYVYINRINLSKLKVFQTL